MTGHAQITTVIFDFSGTLFDDQSVLDDEALIDAARRRNEVLSPQAAATLSRRILERADSPEGRALRQGCDLSPAAHRKIWTNLAASAEGVSRTVAEAFYDCIVDPARWQPYPDTRSTLRALHAGGIRIAVLSNIGWDIRESFRRTGMYELVETFILSCEHGMEKPSPALFHLACELAGTHPSQAIMVGDDPAKDGPAVHAGLATYLLRSERGAGRPRGLHDIVALCGLAPQRAGTQGGDA